MGVRYSGRLELLSRESQVGVILLRIISHRGNLSGPGPRENHPEQIDFCIKSGFDCEVDLWFTSETLLLGHDFGEYPIDLKWLINRKEFLWIHCKNFQALKYLNENGKSNLNYFWHEKDSFTLTSTNKVWVYPGKEIFPDTVAVLPESWTIGENSPDLSSCFAICTDFPEKFRLI